MAQTQRTIELGTGLFVLLGFAALGFLTTQLPGSGLQLRSSADTYTVKARFDDVGGLKVGAPVTMAGVRIGSVAGIGFDGTDYKAVVSLAIDRRFSRIPDDSDAGIQTSGLLGANYVGVTAGGSDTFLRAGSEIALTQSALVLENLINKFFSTTASKKDSGNGNDAK